MHRVDSAHAQHAREVSQQWAYIAHQPQLHWLEREAKRLGVSVSEVLRRIVDQARDA
jgi:methylphosphotriester-DNA--protein-cysteine methyltransferase